MESLTIEHATYIITYYSRFMTLTEAKALRHQRSTIKMGDEGDGPRRRIYLKTGWMTEDPEVLKYLKDGPDQFMINCAQRIAEDNPGGVFFNLCPVCHKLARTPFAKQCRWCGHD